MSVKRLDAKLDQKKIAKQHIALFETSNDVPFLSNSPLVGFCVESVRDLSLFLVMKDGMMAMNVPVVVFVSESVHKKNIPEGVTAVSRRDAHYADMWRACDMAFCLSPEATAEALDAMCVPLALKGIAGLQNYDPNREKGNAFIFEKMNPWLMFAAMVRACETYRFPFDWKCIAGSR